jgi:hypothetical protein
MLIALYAELPNSKGYTLSYESESVLSFCLSGIGWQLQRVEL